MKILGNVQKPTKKKARKILTITYVWMWEITPSVVLTGIHKVKK